MKLSLIAVAALFVAACSSNSVAAEQGALRSSRELSSSYPYINDKGSHPHTPLGLCEGDCDTDHDCAGHLVCGQRSKGHPVPGCRAKDDADLGSNSDFCIQPATPPPATTTKATDPATTTIPTTTVPTVPTTTAVNTQLRLVGNPPHRKLNVCEGDCDSDHDCMDPHTMICQQRERHDHVFGCSGGRSLGDRTDYCVLKANVPVTTTKATTTVATTMATTTKAGETTVPTTKAPSTHLNLVANPAATNSLNMCEGDCDADSDCKGHLVCFQRDEGHHYVPGCTGTPGGRTDYCVMPADTTPTTTKATTMATTTKAGDTTAPTTKSTTGELKLVANPPVGYKLGMCEGDCDTDHDCAHGYLCCHRDAGDMVPGCMGSLGGRTDYCVTPENRATHYCRTHD